MRIVYIDIDSLRPDHLGCYGYHRNTSPNIDAVAREGVAFRNCHASDVPCLPSRTALFAGRNGFHTGVIDHGGFQSQPFIEGADRHFRDYFGTHGFISTMQRNKVHTVTFSPFGNRHSAWHWFAGFNEVHDTGRGGQENADEVSPHVVDWIERNGRKDDWFLHMNIWDPHTPYRVPDEFGDPFEDDPLPAWLTEEVRQQHWAGIGPHSAREILGWSEKAWGSDRRRQPGVAASMDDVRMMFDGYDTGVRYADYHLGKIMDALKAAGIYDDCAIVISADHGENLGELNIYGDHQTADQITTNVPLILKWPGATDSRKGQQDTGLLYHFDVAATVLDMLDLEVPSLWDGRSFKDDLTSSRDCAHRDQVVVSQGAWSCQRAVRWQDYIYIHSMHEGYHGFPDDMLFNVANDPHEQHDLAASEPEILNEGKARLLDWTREMIRTATHPVDPMIVTMGQGGAFHTRGNLPAYLKRLEETDRGTWADWLRKKHPREV